MDKNIILILGLISICVVWFSAIIGLILGVVACALTFANYGAENDFSFSDLNICDSVGFITGAIGVVVGLLTLIYIYVG